MSWEDIKKKAARAKVSKQKSKKIIKNHRFCVLKEIKHTQSDILITADKSWLLLTNIIFVDTFLDMKNIKNC